MQRVDITYLAARGMGQHRNAYPESKVVELADDVESTWAMINDSGGFWIDGKCRVDQEPTFVPASAIIAMRKSYWKGKL